MLRCWFMEQIIIDIIFRGNLNEKQLSGYVGKQVCNMMDSDGYHRLSYETKGPDAGFHLEGNRIEDGDFLTFNPGLGDPKENIVLFQVRYEHGGCVPLEKPK